MDVPGHSALPSAIPALFPPAHLVHKRQLHCFTVGQAKISDWVAFFLGESGFGGGGAGVLQFCIYETLTCQPCSQSLMWKREKLK